MDVNQRIELARKRKLKQLDLSNLALNALPNAIGSLTHLQRLNLAKNNISALPDNFGNLKSLQILNLSGNSLSNLPKSFGSLKSLTSLNIEENDFRVFPEQIEQLSQLKILNVEHNQFSFLSGNFGRLKLLEQLNLSRNLLTALPSSIGHLKALKVLNLKANQLKTLPPEIGKLEALRQLLLTGNPLEKELGEVLHQGIEAIGKFYKNLTIEEKIQKALKDDAYRLDLSNEGLEKIPTTIFKLKNLKILSLDHNYIKNIPNEIQRLTNLEVLDLSHNHLIEEPKILNQMNQLKYYELRGNILNGTKKNSKPILREKEVKARIRKVKKEHLTTLNLSNCGLLEIPSDVFELTYLKQLILGKNYNRKDDKRYRNKIKELPNEIEVFKNLEILHLNHNELSTLPDTFRNLQKIRELHLGNNSFKTLPKAITALGTNVEILDVANNRLTTLEGIFNNFSKLQSLNLSNNQLTELPNNSVNLPALRFLNLSGNQLLELPATISNLKNLEEFHLQGNQITQLPASIGQLLKIHTFDVANNNLADLPSTFGELKANLKAINLSENQFTDLPEEIGELSNLKVLLAANNHFTAFPQAVLSLGQLSKLRLQNNQIDKIPLTIRVLKSLQQISLEGNPLEKDLLKTAKKGLNALVDWLDMQFTKGLIRAVKENKGEKLDLSNRKLKEIPKSVFELSSLKHLILGVAPKEGDNPEFKNRIKELPNAISQLTELETLEISHNKLNGVSKELCRLKKLAHLDISHNQISYLPKDFGNLEQLKYLDIRNNQLTALPLEFAHLKQLETFHFTFNPFQPPYHEINALDLRTLKYWLIDFKIKERLAHAAQNNSKILDLSNCNLTAIPSEVFGFKHLTVLDLFGNDIVEIPAEIAKLKQLRTLSLGNNQLTTLPNDLLKLKKLSTLSLENNPLVRPTLKVAQQGMKVLKNWFQKEAFNAEIERITEEKQVAACDTFEVEEGKQCQICCNEKELNGFDPHLQLHFYHQVCFACKGLGYIENDAEQIHQILYKVNAFKAKDKQVLRTLFVQKKSFEEAMVFQGSPRQTNMNTILHRYESRINVLIGRYHFYEQIEHRFYHILYNQYLLHTTLDQFQKVEELQSGMSLNLSEKTVLQKEMVEEVIGIERMAKENAYLQLPKTVVSTINQVSEKYQSLLDGEN